ncbi:cysteine hydrolase [bacterium]|nr:cysteine hydrolase [bacterium]
MNNKEKLKFNNSVLIVIDIINHCCHPKSEVKEWGLTYRKIRKMVPELKRFISKYKKTSKQPVIYVNCIKWNKSCVAPNIRKLYEDPTCDYYTKNNNKFSEQFYKVTPEKNDIIITKNSYDAFTNPDLNKLLRKKKIRNIVITGVLGDGCVNATIQGGFSRGYNFVILKDLIETMDNKDRQQLQKLLKKYTWPLLYGKTISSKQFIKKFK